MEKDQLAALHSFAQSIFQCRDKEEEWQKLLHDAPNVIIQSLSAAPSVLSDIITADTSEAVVKIIDQAFNAESRQESDPEVKGAQSQAEKSEASVKPDSMPEAMPKKEAEKTDAQGNNEALEDGLKVTDESQAKEAESSVSADMGKATPPSADISDQVGEVKSDASEDAKITEDDSKASAPKTQAVAQAQQDKAVGDEQNAKAGSASSDQQVQNEATAESGKGAGPGSNSPGPRDTSIRCSDQDLTDFLAKVFEGREKEGHLEKMLSSASVGVLNRLQANPFYISQVMKMSNENDLNDFIHLIKQTNGPLIGDEVAEADEISQENIDYLLDNWAYINFDCSVTNKNNELLKDLLADGPEIRWLSDAGVPVLCQVHQMDDREGLTVSMSLRGSLNGFDENYNVQVNDSTVDTVVYGLSESGAWRKMISAFDLVGFMKEMELDHVKMREGHRMMMRNLWALTKINQIECLGFEPTPAESAWYEKREHYLKDKFALSADNELRSAMAPGISPLGTSTSASGEVNEDGGVQESAAEEKPSAASDDGMEGSAPPDSEKDQGKKNQMNTTKPKSTSGSEKAEGSAEAGQPSATQAVKQATVADTKELSKETEVAKKAKVKSANKASDMAKQAKTKAPKKSTDADSS